MAYLNLPKHVEGHINCHAGNVGNGQLVAYEIRQSQDDSLVRHVDCKKKNMMFQRLVHRICGSWGNSVNSSSMFIEFSYSRLGTGDIPNHPINTTNLSSPILSWTDTIYNSNSIDYNFNRAVHNTVVTPAELDGDYRIRYRRSHQHPVATSNVNIREIGYAEASNPPALQGQNINSRIVLDEAIPLIVDQYLVTVYEWEYKLPSYREWDFNDIHTKIVNFGDGGEYTGKIRVTGAFPSHNFANISSPYIIFPIRTIMSNLFYHGYNILNASSIGSSVFGISNNTSFLEINTGISNWNTDSSNNNLFFGSDNTRANLNPGGYNNDGVRRVQCIRARQNAGVVNQDMVDARSLFVFCHQILFDRPFSIYSDQEIDITAQIKLDLLQQI